MRSRHVSVDHIVLATSDLKKAAQTIRRLLGLEVHGGGRHERAGTENAIVPLGEAYLELATVVDGTEAGTHPFGRLVASALENNRAVAAWSAAVAASPALDGVRLTRAGVDVMLYGMDAATSDSSCPFLLHRASAQAVPGAQTDGSQPWSITALTIGGSSKCELLLGGLAVPSGSTEVRVSAETNSSGLQSVTLADPTGTEVELDEEIWSDR